MSATATCPFCNAVVTVGEPNAAGKVLCPRCDGAFPFRPAERAGGVPEPDGHANLMDLDVEVERHRQARQTAARRSIKRAAVVVLGLGVLGVAAGVILSHVRVRTTKNPVHLGIAGTARPTAPAQMPGLGYLPEGTDSVIAVQVRPLIDSLPERSAPDARGVFARLGLPADLVGGFERATGIGLDRIDQLVVGLRLKEGSPLNQVVLVAHVREAFDIDALAKQFKAHDLHRGARTYYRVPPSSRVPVEVYWWAPNDRVLAAALVPEHLDAVPAEPREGLAHLGSRTAGAITRDFTGTPPFWAVLDSDQWETLGPLMTSIATKGNKTPRPVPAFLNSLNTLSVAYELDETPSLTVWTELKSESAAAELRKLLAGNGDAAVGGAGARVMIHLAGDQRVLPAIEAIIATDKK